MKFEKKRRIYMLVKYKDAVVNLSCTFDFYKDKNDDCDLPHEIHFVSKCDGFMCFNFKTIEDRDKAFDQIINNWICKNHFLQIKV